MLFLMHANHRHGWGITPSADAAIHYLSLAASNSAAIESAALSSGSKAGGEAKGELVLAIFELANCFRYGWGVKVDKVAARNYYEVAANLGDPDALEEAAWCHMEGFGGPKDKFKAAQYLRLAEGAGRKSVGNSWYVFSFPIAAFSFFPAVETLCYYTDENRIWKDKYNSPAK